MLLHGWGGSFDSTWVANGWLDAIRAAGRTVIPIDLPGHGPSGGSNDPGDYGMLVDAVGRKIPEDVVVDAIGFSLGAKLVLALAARDMKQYRRIVVAGLGGNAFAPEKLASVLADALEAGLSESTPPAVRRLVDYALGAGNHAGSVAAVLRRVPNPVITPTRLMWLRLPTLVIAGDQDGIAMPLDPLLEAMPHARSVVIPGVDHLGLPSCKAFRDAALAFVD